MRGSTHAHALEEREQWGDGRTNGEGVRPIRSCPMHTTGKQATVRRIGADNLPMLVR